MRRGFPVLWAFLGAAALVTILFYRDFIFHSERLLAGSDMLLEGYPLRKFYIDEIMAGRGVPLWTPHVYAGMPYVGLLPGPIFYPTTILYFVMPLYRAIGWTFVLHTFLGAAFAYFMGRSFRLRPWASAVCGSSFMLTGYVASHLFGGQDGRMFAMTLMPLALGMLERGLRTGDLRWYCGLALTVGLQIFTPHTQVVYFSSLALSLYLLFHLVARVRARSGPAPAWVAYAKPVGGFVLAFAAAAGIGAIQLLPAFALLGHVTRAATEQGYAFAASWALPVPELTALLLPDLIGSLNAYWGQNPIKLHTEYLGAVPAALALLALASSFKPTLALSQRKIVWFLWAATVLAILFALGEATPVHRIAYAILPMISSLRAPAMMMCAVALFIPLLAGFGWEAMVVHREAEPGSRGDGAAGGWPVSWIALGVLGVPVLVLGLAAAANPEGLHRFARLAWFEPGWPRLPPVQLAPFLRSGGLTLLAGFAVAWGIGLGVARGRLTEFAVIAVMAFAVADAWRIDARYLPIGDAETEPAVSDDRVLAALREDAGPGDRVWAFQTYRPNRFMYDGVSSATGSQKFLLEPYARLVGGIRPDDGLLQYPSLLPFLGVKYLIVRQPQRGLEPLAEEPGRLLYRIPVPPHAFFPAEVAAVTDTTEAVLRTRANPDPLSVAVVEVEPGQDPPPAGQGSAMIVRYEPELIELDVTAERAGLLAVSEIYHPGWRAFVDEEEAHVWRTNAAFRGVVVPAGTHRVRFVYESPAFRVGAWLTGLSLFAVALIFWASWRTRRRPRGTGPPPADG